MRRIALGILLTAIAANAFAARITIKNIDQPGIGFNDAAVATPLGGNPGTTLGAQRLNAFQRAADIWGGLLESNVEIVISATFSPINIPGSPCTVDGGVLGQAGPTRFIANFENAPKQNIAYPIALANKFANKDLEPTLADISAQFNSLVDNPTCLGSTSWYYGLDGNHGSNIDLVVVLLHEFAHGLGFSGTNRTSDGSFFNGFPSPFELHTLDTSIGLRMDQMSAQQRLNAVVNTGNLVWDGESTRAAAAKILKPVTTLTVTAPAAIARNYDLGLADFGPAANKTVISGRLVAAVDAANETGPTTTDGCTAFSNASAINGKIALIDRGLCRFVEKARNAQAAGAIGVVIVDVTGTTCIPPGMAGEGATDITIPVISIRSGDGANIRAQLNAGVDATLHVDPSQLAGASQEGYVRLYAPCTLEGGSSVYHWDVTADPNLVMEPSISSDLLHNVDVTLNQLIDIGWVQPSRTGRRILKR